MQEIALRMRQVAALVLVLWFTSGVAAQLANDDRWDEDAPFGEYAWDGAASTHYWISPKHDLVVVTMEQTMPYNWNLEQALKPVIYKAILK